MQVPRKVRTSGRIAMAEPRLVLISDCWCGQLEENDPTHLLG